MALFICDTAGDGDLLNKEVETDENIKCTLLGLTEKIIENDPRKGNFVCDDDEDEEDEPVDEDEDYGGLPPPSVDISHIIDKALAASKKSEELNNKKSNNFENLFNPSDSREKKQYNIFDFSESEKSLLATNIDEELRNSQLNGIEKQHSVPCLSKKKSKLTRKTERSKTKGEKWFDMPATEKTEEIENDLKILQMRSALDPKHFYKKNDLKVLPKYFQIGTVQHSPLDYYNERDTRRNKKRTIVDELMADAEFQKYNKRKYKEVIEKNQKTGYYKALKKMKKLKKKS